MLYLVPKLIGWKVPGSLKHAARRYLEYTVVSSVKYIRDIDRSLPSHDLKMYVW